MALDAVGNTETQTGGIAADRLRSIVERIERLEEERKALAGDIKDIYSEAKSAGFQPPPGILITSIFQSDAASS